MCSVKTPVIPEVMGAVEDVTGPSSWVSGSNGSSEQQLSTTTASRCPMSRASGKGPKVEGVTVN